MTAQLCTKDMICGVLPKKRFQPLTYCIIVESNTGSHFVVRMQHTTCLILKVMNLSCVTVRDRRLIKTEFEFCA